jgi:hypothetical protein
MADSVELYVLLSLKDASAHAANSTHVDGYQYSRLETT